MKIVLVANSKGGVGKTCLSVGLAGAWAEAGRRVLIVDTNNPQHSAAEWLGGTGCPVRVARAEEDDVQLGAILRQLQDGGEYDVILVDTPPRTAAAVRAALDVATTMLVPVTASIADILPVTDMLAQFRAPLDSRVVINCAHQSRTYMGEIFSALCRLPLPVCEAMLGRRLAVNRAQMKQQAVTAYEPAGAAATEIRALAREVWGNV